MVLSSTKLQKKQEKKQKNTTKHIAEAFLLLLYDIFNFVPLPLIRASHFSVFSIIESGSSGRGCKGRRMSDKGTKQDK